MRYLWTAVICWALWFGLSAGNQRGGATFFSVLFAFVPLVGLLWYLFQRASSRRTEHEAKLREAGVVLGTGCDHAEGGTGIAINKQTKTLTMHVKGRSKTYAHADVRTWECVKERAGQIVGVGLFAGMAALGANNRAKDAAAASTGFFVTVRDVDNPKWRIEMKDPGTQARWMELLRQELNER